MPPFLESGMNCQPLANVIFWGQQTTHGRSRGAAENEFNGIFEGSLSHYIM